METPTWIIAIATVIIAIVNFISIMNSSSEIQKYFLISISISIISIGLLGMTFSYLNNKINLLNK